MRTHVGQRCNPVAHGYKKYCGKVFSQSVNVGGPNTFINTVLRGQHGMIPVPTTIKGTKC